MANPDFVGSTTASIESHTALYVPYPLNEVGVLHPPNSPPQSGQTVWLVLSYYGSGSVDAPTVSGWTVAISPGSGTGFHTGLYQRQGDGQAGSALIQWTVAVRGSGIAFLAEGTHTVNPLGATQSGISGSSASGVHSVNGLNTTAGNSLLLGFWTGRGDDGYWASIGVDLPYSYGVAGGMEMAGSVAPDAVMDPNTQIWHRGPGCPITVSYELRGAVGPTGARIAQSLVAYPDPTGAQIADIIAPATAWLVEVLAFQGPSRPTLTAPVDAETITVGRTYPLTWTASTDPNVAQSSLTYNSDYSLNDGLTWTQIVALTSAGVTTYNWNTTGLSPSSQVKLRIRANNGTEFGTYYTTGRFTLAADVLPGAPTGMHGEQPSGTTLTLFDRTLVLLIKGTFSDPGDVMTGFQLDWGTDGITYGNTATESGAVLEKSYALATFAVGITYFRCRAKDTAGNYGAYAFFQLTGATPPAAPNITAPTAGSPPSSPFPTITWTATNPTQYRINITSLGVVKYAGAFVASSAVSITSPFAFLNDTLYTLTVDYRDSSGLTSPSDSESFTVSFTGPATPTISIA